MHNINLERENKEYDPAELILDIDISNISDCLDLEVTTAENPIEVKSIAIL